MEKVGKQQRVINAIIIGIAALIGSGAVIVCTIIALFLTLALPDTQYQSLFEEQWYELNVHANDFNSSEDFEAAKSDLYGKIATVKYKDNPTPYYLLGSLHQILDQRQEAIDSYSKLLDITSNSPVEQFMNQRIINNSHGELAILYHQVKSDEMAVIHLNQMSDLESFRDPELLVSIKNVIEYPDRADFRYELGHLYRSQLFIHHARTQFKAAKELSHDPALKSKADYSLKLKLPTHIQDIKPITRYFASMGLFYKRDGEDYDKAAIFYQKAIEHNPDFEWSHYLLGNMYYELDEMEDALHHGLQSIRINPEFQSGHLLLGDIAIQRESYEEAIKHYEKAAFLGKNSNDQEDIVTLANIENYLGYAYEQVNDPHSAKAHYQKAYDLSKAGTDDKLYAYEALERL